MPSTAHSPCERTRPAQTASILPAAEESTSEERPVNHLATATALLALAACVGCSTPSTMTRRGIERDPDLFYAEGSIERRSSPIGTTRRSIPIHLSFKGGDARGQLLTESIDAGRIAALSCRECFVGSSNYVVINRELPKDIAAEQARLSTSASKAPDFLVMLTVGMVEREISADGSEGTWKLIVSAKDTQRQRQGAVEVYAEVISILDNRTVYSKRAHGLLDEVEQTKGGRYIVASKEQSTRSRTALSDGIREASRELSKDIDEFFGTYLDSLSVP